MLSSCGFIHAGLQGGAAVRGYCIVRTAALMPLARNGVRQSYLR